jgi:exodeoxyribonuclease VII large subunit
MLRQREPREVWRQRERGLQESRRRLQRSEGATHQRIDLGRRQTESMRERVLSLAGRSVRERAGALESRAVRLSSLAPEQTLKRGYSITLDGHGGAIIRDADQARKGQPVRVLLAAGRLEATVDEAIP